MFKNVYAEPPSQMTKNDPKTPKMAFDRAKNIARVRGNVKKSRKERSMPIQTPPPPKKIITQDTSGVPTYCTLSLELRIFDTKFWHKIKCLLAASGHVLSQPCIFCGAYGTCSLLSPQPLQMCTSHALWRATILFLTPSATVLSSHYLLLRPRLPAPLAQQDIAPFGVNTVFLVDDFFSISLWFLTPPCFLPHPIPAPADHHVPISSLGDVDAAEKNSSKNSFDFSTFFYFCTATFSFGF